MKFGDKLQLLSIPEWRAHNFDYTRIEQLIQQLPQAPATEAVADLQHQFAASFESIDKFVHDTHADARGRIRALKLLRADLIAVIGADDYDLNHALATLDGILYHALRISPLIKDLGRFILVQNIAVKKLLDKLPDTDIGDGRLLADTISLLLYGPRLSSRMALFVTVDLVSTANELTALIHTIKSQQQQLVSPASLASSSPLRVASASSIASIHDMPDHVYFDWLALLKKNFSLSLLFSSDSTTLSDLTLNLNVYLNLDTALNHSAHHRLVSYTYLVNKDVPSTLPGYVVSHTGTAQSLVVAYIGGLRKYAHCLLPNAAVEHLLHHLARPLDPSHRELERLLRVSPNTSRLTQLTVETLLSQRAQPAMRRVFSRMRYYVDTGPRPAAPGGTAGTPGNDTDDAVFLDVPLHSRQPLLHSGPRISSLYSSRLLMPGRSENGYFVCLDHDIYCTGDSDFTHTLTLDPALLPLLWDRFPHNYISVHSNDLKLSDFCDSLHTDIDIDHGHIASSFAPSAVHALPAEIAALILRTASLHIFQLFDMYLYCASCYMNVVPQHPFLYNHYTYVLGLNLLKLHENVEEVCTQRETDAVVMRKTSTRVLQRQRSVQRSVQLASGSPWQDAAPASPSAATPLTPRRHGLRYTSEYGASPVTANTAPFPNAPDYADFLERACYPGQRAPLAVALLVHQYLKFKRNATRPAPVPSYGSTGHTGKLREMQLVHEYIVEFDETLASVYFSALAVAVFASGVDVALAYLLSLASARDYRLDELDEAWFLIGWLVGMLLSLGFSACGLSLVRDRYMAAPRVHWVAIWTGIGAVCVSLVMLILFLVKGIRR